MQTMTGAYIHSSWASIPSTSRPPEIAWFAMLLQINPSDSSRNLVVNRAQIGFQGKGAGCGRATFR